jgi:hypothetical protein
MTYPDCPVCKTNINIYRVPDCSTHAEGRNTITGKPDSTFYSDTFKCTCCGGTICYREEVKDDKVLQMKIDYRGVSERETFEPAVIKASDGTVLDHLHQKVFDSLGLTPEFFNEGDVV